VLSSRAILDNPREIIVNYSRQPREKEFVSNDIAWKVNCRSLSGKKLTLVNETLDYLASKQYIIETFRMKYVLDFFSILRFNPT